MRPNDPRINRELGRVKLILNSIFLVSTVPLVAKAESYFCDGDKVAMIAHTVNGDYPIVSAEDAGDEYQWVVGESGVKRFKSGVVEFESCEPAESDMILCGAQRPFSSFSILLAGTKFQYVSVVGNERGDGLLHTMVIGDCREIE